MIYESTVQLTKEFRHGLEQLDMLDTESSESYGLVFADAHPGNSYEYIAMEKASRYDVDAVYFRRFENRDASIPQVYIYDYTGKEKEPGKYEIGELHRRLWNSGQVQMFFVFTKSEVKIFNCLKKPKFDSTANKAAAFPMEVINLAADVDDRLEQAKRREFSARKLDNGSFWDTSVYSGKFQLKDSSYENLLKSLEDVRRNLYKRFAESSKIIDKLLVMSLLLKYLEERVDPDGNKVFPKGFFSRFADGAESFLDILKQNACPGLLGLFDYLSGHFNGEIFKWDNPAERELLSQIDLETLALFLEGRSETSGQRTLWRLYSFNDLPIELISNIYEEFLGDEDKKGIVYTPPYLVHFLIDEAMPLESPAECFKVLDPACGSGVFLVAAYQRIIEWWRIRNNWKKPGLDTLKKLLKDNIHGVDIKPEAVRLAIFSLSLVLLDELSPKEIWEKLKFENLKRSGNLFENDFFYLIKKQQLEGKFDLVIGNPPFVEQLTTAKAKEIEEEQKQHRPPVPGNQLALLFLEQSLGVCKDGGLLCIILPSGPLLYNLGSHDFRTHFFKSCNVKQVLDFTSLSEILFGSANVATAAIYAKKEKPNGDTILHATFRRTKVSKEKIYLQLDHYDFHHVIFKYALDSPLIWKANLLGGGRLFSIISRLAEMSSFGEYLTKKSRENGWVSAEGYSLAVRDDEIRKLKRFYAEPPPFSDKEQEEFDNLKKKYRRAGFLTGKDTIIPEALTEEGLIESMIHTLEDEFFHRPRERNKDIFKGPHVLIREIAGQKSIPVAFTDKYLSFSKQIIGIHAPDAHIGELKEIERRIKNNRVYLFYLAVFSGRYGVNKATSLLKSDIDNLPYPEDKNQFEFSEVEYILMNDVLDYMLDFRRKGETAGVMNHVSQKQLSLFGETYCKLLNTTYKRFKPCQPIETGSFICFPVYYGEKPDLGASDITRFEDNLNRLVYKKMGRNLEITRVLRIYDGNVIYMIKPKQVRYWLRSVAVRDADETFEDLLKQGY